jgi:uncharacterized alpha-E superfamily protein
MMLSRVADALFWMGRYLERAEHVARVLEVTRATLIDLGQVDAEGAKTQWQGALDALSLPNAPTEKLLYDQTEPTSLVCNISRARENARQVREVISTDMWQHLNQAYWSIHEAHARGVHESQLAEALAGVVSARLRRASGRAARSARQERRARARQALRAPRIRRRGRHREAQHPRVPA